MPARPLPEEVERVPDNVFIESEVAMSEHVTKSRYLPPFDRRVLKANVLWNLLGGFAKDEKVPEGSVAHVNQVKAGITRHATDLVGRGRGFLLATPAQ